VETGIEAGWLEFCGPVTLNGKLDNLQAIERLIGEAQLRLGELLNRVTPALMVILTMTVAMSSGEGLYHRM
jgi:hypothetical protein